MNLFLKLPKANFFNSFKKIFNKNKEVEDI